MNIEIFKNKRVSIDMIEDITNIIEDFSETIERKVSSLETKDLYNT